MQELRYGSFWPAILALLRASLWSVADASVRFSFDTRYTNVSSGSLRSGYAPPTALSASRVGYDVVVGRGRRLSPVSRLSLACLSPVSRLSLMVGDRPERPQREWISRTELRPSIPTPHSVRTPIFQRS